MSTESTNVPLSAAFLQVRTTARKGGGGTKTGSMIFRFQGGDLGPICKYLSDMVGRMQKWPMGQRKVIS